MNTLELFELQRERWKRARALAGISNVDAEENFAANGLAGLLGLVSARLLVLPPDPEAVSIDFDNSALERMKQDYELPFGGGVLDLGSVTRTTSRSIVRGYVADDGTWAQYIALHRNGGMEFGLSETSRIPTDKPKRFFLRGILSFVALIGEMQREINDKYRIIGPFEVDLAVPNTKGSELADVATGWPGPDDIGSGPRMLPSLDQNVLASCVFEEWPETEVLLCSLGDRLQQSWGCTERRFVARQGPRAGQIELARYW